MPTGPCHKGIVAVKVVLSRKGFDSSFGDAPSPILPDGRMISLPIPVLWGSQRYRDVIVNGEPVWPLVESVTAGRLKRDDLCHHEPVLEGPHPAFGQVSTAQRHLAGNGIGEGDLVPFFGWFRAWNSKEWGFHAIYGWMEVGAVHQPPFPHRLSGHPHTGLSWYPDSNTIYEARAAGLFRFRPELRLTRPDTHRRTEWLLPATLAGTGISWNAGRWVEPDGSFRSASRGQEFVMCSQAAADWARRLTEGGRHTRGMQASADGPLLRA
jgi:hypothetical protein